MVTINRDNDIIIQKSTKISDANKQNCEIVEIENKITSKLYFSKNLKPYHGASEIITCTDDNEIRLWDITHEVCIASLNAHKNYIWCLEYLEKTGEIISGSSDNKIKVNSLFKIYHKISVVLNFNSFIKVWNINTGDCTHILDDHYNSVLCLKLFSGKLISGSADSNIKIWDLETWECTETLRCSIKIKRCH